MTIKESLRINPIMKFLSDKHTETGDARYQDALTIIWRAYYEKK